MSVSARTFQILYVIRRLLSLDQRTTQADISDFIAERRKSGPHTYDRAYISPSALSDALNRMTTTEGLLTTENQEYGFTPIGSHMADLLDGLDACSNDFIDHYKERVCLAVLEQRARLGQPPATARDVAISANISMDSARRGLEALAASTVILEITAGRTSSYIHTVPERALASKIQSLDPIEELEANEEVEATQEDPIREVLAEIDETDWAPQVTVEDRDEDDLPLRLGQILGDPGADEMPLPPFEKTPVVVEAEVPQEGDEWAGVSKELQQAFINRAKACGMTLSLFLGTVNHVQEGKIREVLLKA